MSWRSLPVTARIVSCFILTLPLLVKDRLRRDKRGRTQSLEKRTGTASSVGWNRGAPSQIPCARLRLTRWKSRACSRGGAGAAGLEDTQAVHVLEAQGEQWPALC